MTTNSLTWINLVFLFVTVMFLTIGQFLAAVVTAALCGVFGAIQFVKAVNYLEEQKRIFENDSAL